MTRWRRNLALTGLWAALALACGREPDAPAQATAPAIDPAFQAALAAGIRRSGDGEGVVEVDSFLASVALESLLAGTSGLEIEPRPGAGGETQGYRIAGVRPGSIFARVGLQDGDVVGAINGIGLTSPARALAALQGARAQFVIGLERGDGALLVELRLIDGLAWSQTLATQGAADEAAPKVAIIDASALVAAVDDEALVAADRGQPPVAPAASAEPVPKASPNPAPTTTPSPKPTKPAPAPASPPKSTSGGGSATSAGSLCTRADTCTVRRGDFNAALANPESAGQQANFVPNSRGYHLYKIKKGSTIDRLGFQHGDLIRTINGHRIADTGEAMALYMSLGGTSTFRVVYERGGKSLTKTIKVV